MKIKLKELTVLPAFIITILVIMVATSLSTLGMQMLSYGSLAVVIVGFLGLSGVYLYEKEMTRYGLLNLVFFMSYLSFTVINGGDLKNAVYNTIEALLPLLIMQYYRHRMKMVIVCFALAYSFCIYWNLLYMFQHPELWIVSEEKSLSGYLLGNNYNGMGCRMVVALITNIICLRFSKLWLLNIIPLVITILVPLTIIRSMTSLTCVLMFLAYCLIPSQRLQKMGTIGLFTVFILFQIFVVFNGKGLENNELAVYFIEDILDKDITFTNRTEMWDSALRVIARSPIIGYGQVEENWFSTVMSSFAFGPHNFILSILIFGGVILLAIYIAICFTAYQSISTCHDRTADILLFGVVTFMFMMLMEMYPYPIVFYLLALANYYPNLDVQQMAPSEADAMVAQE